MSRASALIWVALCIVLGALVWWTTPRQHVVAEGPALLSGFSAADVDLIRITDPKGGVLVLQRGPLEGLWLLQAGATEAVSVVEASRVQGFLRLLAELRSSATADPRPMPTAAIVQLSGKPGLFASVAIDPEFLAGRGRVALLTEAGTAASVAVTSEDLGALVKPEAVREWRSKSLLPWAPDRSNAIAMARRDGATLQAERAGSGWLLTAPVRMRAEPAAAQGVALWLANAAADRFLESRGAEGFDKPSRTISVATDSLSRSRIEQRIELGTELDARSSVIRITGVDTDSGRPIWGPSLAVVQTSLLSGISDEPSAYVAKVCFSFAGADVAAIRFPGSNRVLSRGADGGFGADDANARLLVRLLTEIPSAATTIDSGGDAPAESVHVQFLGLNNALLGDATLSYDTIASRTEGAPSVPAMRVEVDRVRRMIPLERAREVLAAIKALAAAK